MGNFAHFLAKHRHKPKLDSLFAYQRLGTPIGLTTKPQDTQFYLYFMDDKIQTE